MSTNNRFQPSKGWVSLEAIPGRRLQAAELNEIQSLSLYRDRQFGDVIFGAGHVIEGGQVYIKDGKTVIIFPASVYVDGMIFAIGEETLAISGTGEEVVGLKLSYHTVTYEMDPDLLDPAIGHSNFGSPGMNRLVAAPKWVVNDPAAIPMYRIVDGELVTAKIPPELEGFTPVLARRTHDTSGSFLVSGMDGFIEPKDERQVTMVLEAGKAYVLGFEINKLVPTRIAVDKALQTRTVINESKVYKGEASHTLSSSPAKTIKQLTATVQTEVDVTRREGTLLDPLPEDAIVEIYEIKDANTVYKSGTDFKLTFNSVDWSLGGKRPAINNSYHVTYGYVKGLTENKDYELKNNSVNWLSGTKPVTGSGFQVTYEFYLNRKDVFYLTADGEIKVASGQSDVNPPLPPVPPNVLELGELYLPAASDQVKVTNYKPKRLTMLELRSLLDRLERAEYNQALMELDRTARLADPAAGQKGIFSDNFTNFERSDVHKTGFDAMIDPVRKVLQLPVVDQFLQLEVERLESLKMHERLITLDYEDELLIEQGYATESLNVNPYQVFGSQATIRLTPSQDSWVESTTVTRTVWGWWDAWWGGSRTETRVILDENLPFIRVREVTVVGEGFEPDCDNVQATFDGIPITLRPLKGSLPGTRQGTIKADSKGKFAAAFTIPEKVRTGTREVRVFNY